ncbi:MAG: hypothetical protein WC955_11785 [Elusimicrobiota bacterium]
MFELNFLSTQVSNIVNGKNWGEMSLIKYLVLILLIIIGFSNTSYSQEWINEQSIIASDEEIVRETELDIPPKQQGIGFNTQNSEPIQKTNIMDKGIKISSGSVLVQDKIKGSTSPTAVHNPALVKDSFWNNISFDASYGIGLWGWYQPSYSFMNFLPVANQVNTITLSANYRINKYGLRLSVANSQGSIETGFGRIQYTLQPEYFQEGNITKYVNNNSASIIPIYYYDKNAFIGAGIEYNNFVLDYVYFFERGTWPTYYRYNFDRKTNESIWSWQIVFGWEKNLFGYLPIMWMITYKHCNSTVEKMYVDISGIHINLGIRFSGGK